ncbi:hydroxymethylbilane synthase [Bacteroidetes/Chlorobi group bacterium Naka2016]|jgi:hydroxymethylbilane synthase|nr:MAG: hydroxymethylbilane synthase [Bacteroidetes/Chlorobi group bacterium Naka2016]
MIERRLKVGSRGSKLAIVQTHLVLKQLQKFFPHLVFELKIIKTTGDKFQNEDFSKIEGKGFFTKEIEENLLRGEIDIAVHSLKDLPTELPEGLTIGAFIQRENPEDVLVAKNNKFFIELPTGAKIGTSSLRRKVQLLQIRPDLNIVPLRGNVTTRLQKLFNSDLDAIIVARAGLERLGLQYAITEIFSPEVIIPAVGQGAIAIEIRKDNEFAKEVLEGINDVETEYAVRAERAFLRELGGGCHNPIAAYAIILDYEIFIEGMIASPDGQQFFRGSTFGLAIEPEKVGQKLAREILALGAKSVLTV